jgi:hypothetical protein
MLIVPSPDKKSKPLVSTEAGIGSPGIVNDPSMFSPQSKRSIDVACPSDVPKAKDNIVNKITIFFSIFPPSYSFDLSGYYASYKAFLFILTL